MRRFLKWLFVGSAVLLGALAILVIAAFVFPPEYKAVTQLPGTDAHLTMTLKPSHPFLAEYERTLTLSHGNKDDVRQVLLSDTGGYSRSQLYALPNGDFLLTSYFDQRAIISTKNKSISILKETLSSDAKYLGAFTDDSSRTWRFMKAVESPEQSLVATGG
jgi:hypothetical protein